MSKTSNITTGNIPVAFDTALSSIGSTLPQSDNAVFGHMAKKQFSPETAGQVVFYSNLYFENAPTAGILEGNEVNQQIRHALELLHCRMFLASDGNIVLPKSLFNEIKAYAKIAEDLCWVSKNSFERVIFVDNIFNLSNSLAEITRQRPGVTLVPYGARTEFVHAARQQNLSVDYSDEKTCQLAVEYGDKTTLRNLVADLQMEMKLPLQPRAAFWHTIHADFSGSDRHVLNQMIEIADINHNRIHANNPDIPFMFLQVSNSGGGFGNFRVFKQSSNPHGFIVKTGNGDSDLVFNSAYELGNYIGQLRTESNIELAPFFEITDTFSYGVMCTDDAIAVLGRREQILNDQQGYEGFKLVASPAINNLERQAEIMSLKIASKLQELGYRGPFGIDFMIYRAENGNEQLGVAEINSRFDATSPITQWVLRNSEREQALFRGNLAIMQNDHIHIPRAVAHDTETLIAKLRKADIPIYQPDPFKDNYSENGVVLLSPLIADLVSNKPPSGRVLLAVIASTDHERDNIYSQALEQLEVTH